MRVRRLGLGLGSGSGSGLEGHGLGLPLAAAPLARVLAGVEMLQVQHVAQTVAEVRVRLLLDGVQHP